MRSLLILLFISVEKKWKENIQFRSGVLFYWSYPWRTNFVSQTGGSLVKYICMVAQNEAVHMLRLRIIMGWVLKVFSRRSSRFFNKLVLFLRNFTSTYVSESYHVFSKVSEFLPKNRFSIESKKVVDLLKSWLWMIEIELFHFLKFFHEGLSHDIFCLWSTIHHKI